ncbi:GMP synthase [Fluoribacter dumoffii]|uniref:GMP synthase [glutamine-hydrolyzing] n=1 Tax=Fluoribacter dumoffii TaxID=463 RepID=A0A377G8C1_9GAMM|nr:GMP synthase [Fluoribacter dumoffii]KTC89959.1 glutamine amidotransferase, class I [Fluoribacter dumoffii NY 23]MCW8385257.1 GMP synthase [Fluoribacter dumoffii]MCW8418311.1 GMP synthase [Fluoribacter dumoffii]MCW8453847.1 GMP synthase [Fluoribacter dumoffii]MCW8462082.1 GMP synthase [Fluoribacter dumoffii]
MKIGILQCDQVDTELLGQFGTYAEMYNKLLQKAKPDLSFTVYDVRHNEFPTHIHSADAYIITGSRYGVNDDLPWITALEDFVRHLHVAEKKAIGICFGHQLIAKALGGKVVKSPKGWGIGVATNKMVQHKSWMIPPLEDLSMTVSHQDQVVALPSDAEVLAASDFCPFYMLQIGNNLMTVQGHPEYSKNYIQALIEIRKHRLGKKLTEEGLKSLQQSCNDSVFAQWIVNFLSV